MDDLEKRVKELEQENKVLRRLIGIKEDFSPITDYDKFMNEPMSNYKSPEITVSTASPLDKPSQQKA